MATTYLTRTSGTPTLNTKYTLSFWVKRSKITYSECFMFDGRVDSSNRFKLSFNSGDKLECFNSHSGSNTFAFNTNRLFRDTSAWYHIVLAVDTTQSGGSDRVKLYVNGVQEESFASYTDATQNDANNVFNENSSALTIGAYYNATNVFDGLMSYVAFVDGTQELPTIFGETDSTTGEWKIKTSITPSSAWGNNGFLILKNGNSLTDESGNSNNFTLGGGTLTKTEDCPSNVFATLNALKQLTGTLSNGNTTWTANGDNGVWSTIGNNSGKYYWETQQNANSTMMGIVNEDIAQTTGLSGSAGVYGVQNGTTYAYYRNNGSSGQSSGFPNPTNSNVVCHALDLDNGKYFMGVDGVFKNLSGTTSNLSTGADPTYSGLDTTKFWFPFIECRGNGAGCDANFGNGYFGTTAVASAGTNASGIGIFEYDVPTGYTALSTKGLNE